MSAIRRFVRPTLLLLVLAGVVGGVPWALSAYFGSSLPDGVPGYGDVKAWLDAASLFPTQALTDVLVWAAWVLWAMFTLQITVQLPGAVGDTARCLRTGVTLPTVENANLAGRLLTTIAMSVIAARGTLGVATAATEVSASSAGPRIAVAGAAAISQVHVVVHGDCLWDVAERRLGDGERWHEIFELNRHRVQDDGGALTNPDLIRPGWRLVLPGGASATAARPLSVAPVAVHATPASPATSSRLAVADERKALAPQTRSAAVSHRASSEQRPAVRRPVAVGLPNGGYVSLTLAAGFSAALAAAQVRSRVRPQRRDPGEEYPQTERLSATESTLLQAAADLGYHERDDPYVDESAPADAPSGPKVLAQLRAPEAVYIGVRDGRPISLEAAAIGGLALLGDGAAGSARALLLSCLTAGGYLAGSPVFHVVTTDVDLRTLLGEDVANRPVEHLTVCATYDEAVKVADTATGRRLLLATPNSHPSPAAEGVSAVLLGERGSATVADVSASFDVAADGANVAILNGATAYHLDMAEARVMFDKLPVTWDELDRADDVPPARIAASDEPDRRALEPVPIPPQASHAKPTASEAITINVLGPVQILCHGADITSEVRSQLAALLTYLALHKNGVSRTALAADLWPKDDPAKHRGLLTTALSHTRSALTVAYGSKPEFFPKDRTAGVAYLNPKYFDADMWRFDALTKRREGLDAATWTEALSEAITLYRGEVAHRLEHVNRLTEQYENWLRPIREDYWRKVIDAHQDLAELVRGSDSERALDMLDQAIRMEPWNQRLYETTIGIHLDIGQRHAAEHRFRELADLLASLGTKPDGRITHLVTTNVA